MKRFLCIVTLILISILTLAACRRGEKQEVGPPAPPNAVPDITGEYAVNGFDPSGIEYSGRLTIFPGETAVTYTLQWIVNGSIQEGNGRLDGNVLQVNWRHIESVTAHSQGTATYTVSDNGVLDGVRTAEGLSGEGTETAYPNK